MSNLETNAKDNVADTIEADEAEGESIAVLHKSGRKWPWIGASVFGVVLVGAVGAGVGARNDAGNGAGTVMTRELEVESQRGDYELYANDENAEGRLREPVCWIRGPDNLPVKVLSFSASEIVFDEGHVQAKNDVVCGGGRGAAPSRRRLGWRDWADRFGRNSCIRIKRDCIVSKAESFEDDAQSNRFSVACSSVHYDLTEVSGKEYAVFDIMKHGIVISHEETWKCEHKGWYHPIVAGEPEEMRFYDGVTGTMTMGKREHETYCARIPGTNGCKTQQTCVDFECA